MSKEESMRGHHKYYTAAGEIAFWVTALIVAIAAMFLRTQWKDISDSEWLAIGGCCMVMSGMTMRAALNLAFKLYGAIIGIPTSVDQSFAMDYKFLDQYRLSYSKQEYDCRRDWEALSLHLTMSVGEMIKVYHRMSRVDWWNGNTLIFPNGITINEDVRYLRISRSMLRRIITSAPSETCFVRLMFIDKQSASGRVSYENISCLISRWDIVQIRAGITKKGETIAISSAGQHYRFDDNKLNEYEETLQDDNYALLNE